MGMVLVIRKGFQRQRSSPKNLLACITQKSAQIL
jgi:hypothetical protein